MTRCLRTSLARHSARSGTLTELWTVGDHRLRIRIHLDAYRFQSWAVIERWDGGRWQEVYRLDGRELQVPEPLPLGPLDAAWFDDDRATLLAAAKDVLL